jgi:predicted enzyme related to lactoylglutathione lyase
LKEDIMPRVIHFEFAADNPERAAKFYREVFGWESTQWGGPMDYWLVKTGADGPGIDGGIIRYQDKMPRTINSVEVNSVDDYVEKATHSGGKIAKPKMTIPGVGYQAYLMDTESNVFGVFQPDPSAK